MIEGEDRARRYARNTCFANARGRIIDGRIIFVRNKERRGHEDYADKIDDQSASWYEE